jgi:hypothetical protein
MRRHPLDLVSLVFGLAFAALATAALVADPVQLVEARWLWPGLLIVLGLALLLAPLGGRERTADEATHDHPHAPAADPSLPEDDDF